MIRPECRFAESSQTDFEAMSPVPAYAWTVLGARGVKQGFCVVISVIDNKGDMWGLDNGSKISDRSDAPVCLP